MLSTMTTPAPGGSCAAPGSGLWSAAEHAQFKDGVVLHGWGNWCAIESLIPSRRKSQIKSHAQKCRKCRPAEVKELVARHEAGRGLGKAFAGGGRGKKAPRAPRPPAAALGEHALRRRRAARDGSGRATKKRRAAAGDRPPCGPLVASAEAPGRKSPPEADAAALPVVTPPFCRYPGVRCVSVDPLQLLDPAFPGGEFPAPPTDLDLVTDIGESMPPLPALRRGKTLPKLQAKRQTPDDSPAAEGQEFARPDRELDELAALAAATATPSPGEAHVANRRDTREEEGEAKKATIKQEEGEWGDDVFPFEVDYLEFEELLSDIEVDRVDLNNAEVEELADGLLQPADDALVITPDDSPVMVQDGACVDSFTDFSNPTWDMVLGAGADPVARPNPRLYLDVWRRLTAPPDLSDSGECIPGADGAPLTTEEAGVLCRSRIAAMLEEHQALGWWRDAYGSGAGGRGLAAKSASPPPRGLMLERLVALVAAMLDVGSWRTAPGFDGWGDVRRVGQLLAGLWEGVGRRLHRDGPSLLGEGADGARRLAAVEEMVARLDGISRGEDFAPPGASWQDQCGGGCWTWEV